jgi:hypothetical protein
LVLSLAVSAVSVAWSQETSQSIEGKYLSNVRQLTHGFVKAGEGYFSPDGQTSVSQAVPQDYPY